MNFGALANAGASGFLEGARTAAEIQDRLSNQESQKRADELAQQHLTADTALKEREYALRENEYAQNAAHRDFTEANQAAQQNRQAELYQGQQALQAQTQELSELKLRAAQQEQAREEGKQTLRAIQAASAADPSYVPDYNTVNEALQKSYNGLSLEHLASPKLTQAFQMADDFASGKRKDFTSPDVLEGMASLYPQALKRGIGDPVTFTDENGQVVTGKIAEKKPRQIIVDHNGPPDQPLVMALDVSVVDDAGKVHKYVAPATVHGTSDPEDPILHFHPDAPLQRAKQLATVRAFMEDTYPQMLQQAQKPLSALDMAKVGTARAQQEKYKAEAEAIRGKGQGKPWNEKEADSAFGSVFKPTEAGSDTKTAADYVDSRFLGQKIPEGENVGSVAMSRAKQDAMNAHRENQDVPQDAITTHIATGKWTVGVVRGKEFYGYASPSGDFLAVKPYNGEDGLKADLVGKSAPAAQQITSGTEEPSVGGFVADTAGRAASAVGEAAQRVKGALAGPLERVAKRREERRNKKPMSEEELMARRTIPK